MQIYGYGTSICLSSREFKGHSRCPVPTSTPPLTWGVVPRTLVKGVVWHWYGWRTLGSGDEVKDTKVMLPPIQQQHNRRGGEARPVEGDEWSVERRLYRSSRRQRVADGGGRYKWTGITDVVFPRHVNQKKQFSAEQGPPNGSRWLNVVDTVPFILPFSFP